MTVDTEPPGLPAGIDSVLSVLSSSAVVLDGDDRVLRASAAARSFGLVDGDRLVVSELVALARKVRRDGEIREGEIDLATSRFNGRTTSFAVRVGLLGSTPAEDGLVLLLAEDQTESRRVDEVRRDFVANISHELKTPVGALALLAETVEDAAHDPEAVLRFAGRMRQEATRLTDLVQDLIMLSRIQAAEPVPDPTPLGIDTVVAEALDRCRLRAAAHGIELAASGEAGMTIDGDEDLMVTALRNLLENAVAYSPEKTRVLISTRRAGAARGRDQRGRPGHRHPRARPRAHLRAVLPGGSRPVQGDRRDRPGPGHRQARHRRARRHDHGVEQGRGRVHLHHPAAPQQRGRAARRPPGAGRLGPEWPHRLRNGATCQGDSQVTRVLVVEDEESFSDALSYMLRKEGFEVAICPTGPMRSRPSTGPAPTWCCSTSCCPACPAARCAGACVSGRTSR